MDKKLEQQLKAKLESEKKRLTKDLSAFAQKDPKMKRNWINSVLSPVADRGLRHF